MSYDEPLKLERIAVISFFNFSPGTFKQTLKQFTTSISVIIIFSDDVPIIISFLSGLGGFFLIRTRRAYKKVFENLGPI